MRNMTITLEEKVAKWARIEAARKDTSVSRMVGEMLAEKMQHEDTYAAAMRSFFASPARIIRQPGEALPKREELYDRKVLR
jgi:hypothetical protein